MDDIAALAAFRNYQEDKGLAENHIANSYRELRTVRGFLGGVPLVEASYELLNEWATTLKTTCNKNSRYVKISRVHAFYVWAYAEDIIDHVPSRRIPRPKITQGLPRPTPPNEVRRAIDRAQGEMRLWLMLAALAGLRCCEIAELKRDEIQDTANPPHLRPRGKGDKVRIVYLCDDLLAEIKAYPLPNSGWVFERRDGQDGHPSPSMVSWYGNQFLHGVGVRETMHQLRHRFITDVYEASDLPTASSQAGHANLQTTRGYAQLNDLKAAKAVQSLGLHRKENDAA